ncbi:MAG: hypothetical protein D3912_12935 [Candidatus Electrothrix sp. AX1]|nr:hypothetical protein [Candidatus Electrothrix sp. AX1]
MSPVYSKPARPEWMDEAMYNIMPDTLTIREIKAGGKVLASTLLDPKEVTKKELADLYVKRWVVEVDLRSIKETLQMDVLRCNFVWNFSKRNKLQRNHTNP